MGVGRIFLQTRDAEIPVVAMLPEDSRKKFLIEYHRDTEGIRERVPQSSNGSISIRTLPSSVSTRVFLPIILAILFASSEATSKDVAVV